jgi:hypothetical protein
VTDDAPSHPKEILIGKNERLKPTHLKVSREKLEDDGFLLKTLGQKLIIAG